MEVDSIHAAIECAKKNTAVNIPNDWQIVCHLARWKKPYVVVPIRNNDILDLNELISNIEIKKASLGAR